MDSRRDSRLLPLMIGLLVCACAPSQTQLKEKGAAVKAAGDSESTQRQRARHFFEQLVGRWTGTGTGNDGPARDSVVWEWTLNDRFLRMNYVAHSDPFRAEGYLWDNSAQSRIEFYEFNNGEWPVRMLTGELTDEGKQLRLEEHPPGRDVSLIIRLNGASNWDFQEAHLLKDHRPGDSIAQVAFVREKNDSNGASK